jgi:hypothetical protein
LRQKNTVRSQPETHRNQTLQAVPASALIELAEGDPMRAMGIISDVHTAMLVAYLPDICRELLALRAAAAHQDPITAASCA